MYDPIIEVTTQMQEEIDRQLGDAVVARLKVNYAIDVQPDELIKALAYDRDQYHKGYQDGYRRAYKKFAELYGNIRSSFEGFLKEDGYECDL